MSDEKYDDLPYVAFIGAYADVEDAKADFDGIKALHANLWIGPYDGALFTKEEGGKVKILDRDSAATGGAGLLGGLVGAFIGLIFPPSIIMGGAVGTAVGALAGHLFGGFKRSDIKEIGDMLDEGTAGIVMIGVATPEMGADLYMKRAARVAKKQVDADAKDLKKAIDEAAKSN
jgi:uncharacterized membrane protein